MTEQISSTSSIQPFRPRARIMRILGDELVSSEIVALTELVKNAYDADATRILLHFRGPLEIDQGAIEVIDNGHGMSFEDIETTWMEPATLNRKRKTISQKYGRRVLGEKGIGRFAASRLANHLELVTRQTGGNEEFHVLFDWTQFDDEKKYLDQIEFSCKKFLEPFEICPEGTIGKLWSEDEQVNEEEMTHGTIMRMVGLRKKWSERQIEELRTSLSRLVSPFLRKDPAKEGSDLNIYIKFTGEFEPYSGLIKSPEALEHPLYSVKGHVNESGGYNLTFKLMDQEEEHDSGKLPLDEGYVPKCGPFDIELHVWERDPLSLEKLAQYYDMSLRGIRRLLGDAAGVSIYRDGFRVLPYGEPRHDWLRLDPRKINSPERFSNNQIVGSVSISADNNPLLRDQSNREGIMEGEALQDLRKLVTCVLTKLEARKIALKKDKQSSQKELDESDKNSAPKAGLFAGFDLDSVHDYITQRHPRDKELLDLVCVRDKEIEVKLKNVQEVLARYQRLAVLGSLIDKVLHEGRAPLSKIGNETILGLRDIKRSNQISHELLGKLDQRLKFIKTQSDVLATVFRRIEPFGGRKRGKPQLVGLKQVISNAISVLDKDIERAEVQIILPENDIEFLADPVEIQEIFINLLDNSIYWLRKVPKEQRRIVIQMDYNNDEMVEIIFSDSGPGVDPKDKKNIFYPYFSMKPDGIGLGLTLAGEIVTEYYNGSLELIDGGPLHGATFRITLGKRGG